jgi:hypothetical protein
MKFTEFSSWVDYPDHYKFFSVHFELNQDVTHINRRTYDVLGFARDLGGVVFMGLRVFGGLAAIFAKLRLESLLTNRLFYLSQEQKSNFQMNQDNLFRKNSFNEIGIKFPKYIDLQYLRFTLCRCCCKVKNERFSRFHSLVKQSSDDFLADMDIVRLVRRIRCYGIALYYLTSR